jgi:hypothetical protein
MRILMTRTNPNRHRFAVIRADGTTESADLETHSMLVHDLVHYAVEMEAPFREGFYGLLAQGRTFSQLNDTTQPWPVGTEIAAAEGLVGPLQSMLKTGNFNAEDARKMFELFHSDPPPLELLTRIGERFRSVLGRYNATKFGDTLELDWPEGQTMPVKNARPWFNTRDFGSPKAPCAPNPKKR